MQTREHEKDHENQGRVLVVAHGGDASIEQTVEPFWHYSVDEIFQCSELGHYLYCSSTQTQACLTSTVLLVQVTSEDVQHHDLRV